MLTLIPLMLLAAVQNGPPTIGERAFSHAGGGPDPVDLVIRPRRVPDCRTDAEIRKALADKEQGVEPLCMLPKDARPAKRR
jgi:hypothetical protein